MADTLICLVRHGQSSHNLRELVAGQVPSCLTRRGREDARAVAVLLKGRPFDLIYSSDLRRALQTAEVIRDSLGLGCPIRISSLLRELDYGRFTQRPVRETFAFLDYRRRRDRPYPGGESFGDLKRRAEAFAERLRSGGGRTEPPDHGSCRPHSHVAGGAGRCRTRGAAPLVRQQPLCRGGGAG